MVHKRICWKIAQVREKNKEDFINNDELALKQKEVGFFYFRNKFNVCVIGKESAWHWELVDNRKK